MLYELFLITFGIYVGQEYPIVPRVKLVISNLIIKYNQNYSNDKSDNNDVKQDTYDFLKVFFSSKTVNEFKQSKAD
jgi:hypothetical protein